MAQEADPLLPFVSDRDGNDDIFVADSNTENIRNL
jgi:hypothetical protein